MVKPVVDNLGTDYIIMLGAQNLCSLNAEFNLILFKDVYLI